MPSQPLPSASLAAPALQAPSPSAFGFMLRALVVSLCGLLAFVALLVCLRLVLFETVSGELTGFFRDQLGLQRHTALTLGLGGAVLGTFVAWRSALRLSLGRLTPLAGMAVGTALLAYWTLSQYATVPMSPQGRINQKYAIVDGRCEFFDVGGAVDPRTGKALRVVTADVLQACAARKNGKAPKAVDASHPEAVEWFDRVLGYANVYYAVRPNGSRAYFDAPGADPLTGQPLEPVTAEVATAAVRLAADTAALSVLPAPASTLAPDLALDPRSEVLMPPRTPLPPVEAAFTAPARVGSSAVARPNMPATGPFTRQAVVWSGPASEHANAMLGQLQRRGVVNAPLRLKTSWATPVDRVDTDALAQAHQQGAGTVAVMSLHADIQSHAQLAGFTHAVLQGSLHIYSTAGGALLGKHHYRAEGRGFTEREAIAAALAAL